MVAPGAVPVAPRVRPLAVAAARPLAARHDPGPPAELAITTALLSHHYSPRHDPADVI